MLNNREIGEMRTMCKQDQLHLAGCTLEDIKYSAGMLQVTAPGIGELIHAVSTFELKTEDTSKNNGKEAQSSSTDKFFTLDEIEAKNIKKKLKKQRQREKKKSERPEESKEEETDERTSDSKDNIPIIPSPDIQQKLDDDTEETNAEEIDENEGIDFVNEIPAFLSTALKKGSKNLDKFGTKAKADNKNIYVASVDRQPDFQENYSDNENNDFTFVKVKRNKQVTNAQQSSEDMGKAALKFITKNNISVAIAHLSEAIQRDPLNLQHYVNRSFCYLRSNEYSSAIMDAQYVLTSPCENKILGKVKYILAQALCNIKNYEEAEKQLKECLSLYPKDILRYLQREILQVKCMQLTNLGFDERSVINALECCATTMEAIELLTKTPLAAQENNFFGENTDENEVYYSDDDDSDSNASLLTSLAYRYF